MNYNIAYTFEAFTTIRDALDWWTVHRRSVPDLLKRELHGVLARLESFPHSGTATPVWWPPLSRRVLVARLPRTGYRLYYHVDDKHHVVTVYALHHTARGSPPRIP